MHPSDFNLQFQNQSTESKIVVSLERISQAFRVLLWQESKEHSLSPLQVQVLIFILYHRIEQCTVSYLAAEFNLTKATISDTVKALEQKSLILKTTLEHDTRSQNLVLTEEGRDTALKNALFTREIHQPLEKLREEDKESMLRDLLNIIHHLNQIGIISIQRMCTLCVHHESNKNGAAHYCNLLDKPLKICDLRIDCPEFDSTKQT